MPLEFDLPKENNSIIKVIGVGGGGSNAVNHMFNQGIAGVDFIVCNTDRQALDISPVPYKIQLGPTLTEGRGAGMIPEIGMNAAMENIEEIRELLSKNTKMVFVTAGLGGGTGTGAAPVIAQAARDLGILTVGIVTVPFNFEGRKRRQQAEDGLNKMRENVDTLLIINNERLRDFGKDMSLSEAFGHADNILTVAAKGIAEVISVTGIINVDFNDVNTVLRNSGRAIMGSAIGEGENRALDAVQNALVSPLLNDNDISGAKYVLLNITYGNKEVMMDEITEITDYIQDAAGATADVIWGHGYDGALGDKLNITLIATGFSSEPLTGFEKAPERKVVSLDEESRKELLNPLESPLSVSSKALNSTESVPTVSEQLQQEPFLKVDINEPIINNAKFPSDMPNVNDTVSLFTDESNVVENEAPLNNASLDQSVESSSVEKISYNLFDTTEETDESSQVTPIWNDALISETGDTTQNNEFTDKNTESPEFIEQSGEAFTWELTTENEKDSLNEDEIKITSDEGVVKHLLDDEISTSETSGEEKSSMSAEDIQKRTNDRVSKIQEYTSKLKKADGINEFEKEPAFVRRNINLNTSTPSTEENFSRFGLADDGTGKFSLKNNNFLHDNVD
ncbi:MAG: cell division protein FtsZ [Bacteroidetes bacterium]|nr:cell division protein FtsZ [Bacteroidota bacterium]